jgi:hypothetical protein
MEEVNIGQVTSFQFIFHEWTSQNKMVFEFAWRWTHKMDGVGVYEIGTGQAAAGGWSVMVRSGYYGGRGGDEKGGDNRIKEELEASSHQGEKSFPLDLCGKVLPPSNICVVIGLLHESADCENGEAWALLCLLKATIRNTNWLFLVKSFGLSSFSSISVLACTSFSTSLSDIFSAHSTQLVFTAGKACQACGLWRRGILDACMEGGGAFEASRRG